jgi:DNA-binding MarR family transcriptional regulator
LSSERDQLLQQLSSVVRRNQRATDAVDEAAQGLMGINRSDGRALDFLDQRGRVTAGELAREMALTTGAITAVIDRLERAGYARRVADPEDRRRVLVEITDRARELSWELFGPLAKAAGPLLEGYDDDQLRMLIEFNELAAGMQERHAAWLRTQPSAPGYSSLT